MAPGQTGRGRRASEPDPTFTKWLCFTCGVISKCVCYELSCVVQNQKLKFLTPGLQNVTGAGDRVFKEVITLK